MVIPAVVGGPPGINGNAGIVWAENVSRDWRGERLNIDNLMIDNGAARTDGNTEFFWQAEHDGTSLFIIVHAKNTANVVKRTNKIYTNAIDGLAKQNLDILKKNKKGVVKLGDEVDDLRDHIFYFIKNLDDASVGASNFYINILGSLQDMTQSLEYITKISYKHINNNHKKLKYNQIKELKEIDYKLEHILNETQVVFETRSFDRIAQILEEKEELFTLLSQKIQKQVERTRTEESSPKNTTLYFSLLLETKDLMTATMTMLELYYNEHDSSVPPATIS